MQETSFCRLLGCWLTEHLHDALPSKCSYDSNNQTSTVSADVMKAMEEMQTELANLKKNMANRATEASRVREEANATCTRALALAEQKFRENLEAIEQMYISKNQRDMRECKEDKSKFASGCGRI